MPHGRGPGATVACGSSRLSPILDGSPLLPIFPRFNRFVCAGAAAAFVLAGLAGPAHAAEKVTPDVTGIQRVLVVGCRFHDTTSPDILDYSNSGIRRNLSHTHDYFDTQSNHRVDFEGE